MELLAYSLSSLFFCLVYIILLPKGLSKCGDWIILKNMWHVINLVIVCAGVSVFFTGEGKLGLVTALLFSFPAGLALAIALFNIIIYFNLSEIYIRIIDALYIKGTCQMKWACPKCGRIFELEQVENALNPFCFLCGPETHLKKWREDPKWKFVFWGTFSLPTIGYLLVLLSSFIGFFSKSIILTVFFFIPAVLAAVTLIMYFTGSALDNRMMKRAGMHGFLILFGFCISISLLLISGYFLHFLGISQP